MQEEEKNGVHLQNNIEPKIWVPKYQVMLLSFLFYREKPLGVYLHTIYSYHFAKNQNNGLHS